MKKLLGLFLLLAVVFSGCTQKIVMKEVAGDVPNLFVAENSKSFPSMKISIAQPTPNQVVTSKNVAVQINLKGFNLGKLTSGSGDNGLAFSKQGQHLHLILDNSPYQAVYDISKPIVLTNLTPGLHSIRVFASRSWHESIKDPNNYQEVYFYVLKKTTEKQNPISITYSRPKGEYVGKDAETILVDFYLKDANFPEKHQVKLSVDGKSSLLKEWKPYFVKGLSAGDHEFVLELVDETGKLVPGSFTATKRKITVK